MTAATLICDARAEHCRCGLQPGHDGAWRATNPAELRAAPDPVGPENHRYLESLLDIHSVWHTPLIVAWGATAGVGAEADRLIARAHHRGVTLWCLGRTKAGAPRHPLYLPADARLEVWP